MTTMKIRAQGSSRWNLVRTSKSARVKLRSLRRYFRRSHREQLDRGGRTIRSDESPRTTSTWYLWLRVRTTFGDSTTCDQTLYFGLVIVTLSSFIIERIDIFRSQCHCSGAIGYWQNGNIRHFHPTATRSRSERLPGTDSSADTRIGPTNTESGVGSR